MKIIGFQFKKETNTSNNTLYSWLSITYLLLFLLAFFLLETSFVAFVILIVFYSSLIGIIAINTFLGLVLGGLGGLICASFLYLDGETNNPNIMFTVCLTFGILIGSLFGRINQSYQ